MEERDGEPSEMPSRDDETCKHNELIYTCPVTGQHFHRTWWYTFVVVAFAYLAVAEMREDW
jgi:hypothetical protein